MQLELHEIVKHNPQQSYVLGLEHPAVMTLGYRARAENEILNQLVSIPVVRATRGGLATVHSEGQLVIYPILDLREQRLGVRSFVELLLAITKDVLQGFGIEAELDQEKIGLYTRQGKIAFCGLQIKNGISLHGLSINMTNDLTLFEQIMACGVQKQKMDCTGHYLNIEKQIFFQKWTEALSLKLGYWQ